MAKAIVTERKVEITLTLSEEEAIMLHATIGNSFIGTQESPRKYSDAIYHALDSVIQENGLMSRSVKCCSLLPPEVIKFKDGEF
jgi:hypothetical protein